jgi:hypothetical protein
MTFYIKQNDTVPSLRADLKNGDDEAIDLTGASVKFIMRAIGSTTVTTNASASIVDDEGGTVQYNWQAEDTDTVGSYQAEFEVTYAGGTIETFPNDGYIRIEILDDIA